MVAGGLRGGVGGIGLVGALFVPRSVVCGEGAVDFVGRDVEEAEIFFFRRGELGPMKTRGVEEAEGADDVGLDEGLGGIDRAVDVGLGGEVDDCVDRVVGEKFCDEGAVTDVAVRKNVAGIGGEVGEVGGIAGVGEGVEVDEFREGRAGFGEALADEVGADEAAAAGD